MLALAFLRGGRGSKNEALRYNVRVSATKVADTTFHTPGAIYQTKNKIMQHSSCWIDMLFESPFCEWVYRFGWPRTVNNLSKVTFLAKLSRKTIDYFVASELKDPIWHSSEWQIDFQVDRDWDPQNGITRYRNIGPDEAECTTTVGLPMLHSSQMCSHISVSYTVAGDVTCSTKYHFPKFINPLTAGAACIRVFIFY